MKKETIDEMAIVTRNPCLDPADIRLVKCVGKEEILTRFQRRGIN